ncbi:lauroyl acyltransferase [Rhodovulum sulfidophilum]|uniref:lysophospholipid acyltransferase family protein n=1 Tax=Rhodovulum sulfidophilum TaxID=35806 RepID=UPI0019205EE8|nr:lauroyl acyltransferase [Rhodovulum sulfidophilum]MBL3574762.1 lauroyl acyltransferase [Rhodovulum sulfidophilum]MCE8430688.1 lauroyl acyltransferase [Rhodovulum sulfidophilum]MCF4117592.1 lauroyl acyltransferase [Rhodovulum sulfidophilum]
MGKRNKPSRRLGDWLTDRVARLLIATALALPYERRVPFGGWVTRRLIAPIAGYRDRAEANLAMIWPDMPAPRRRRIADQVADNAGRTLIENYSTEAFLARMAGTEPKGPGLAALAAARQEGRPAILVTGHFGNYEAARAALVARGYEIGGLYRPMANPFFNAHYVRTMEAFGGPVFPQGRRGTTGFVRHLRSGGMLVLLTDQHARRGAELHFMGHPALTALSAAELALRYDAELIPFYATRCPDGLSFEIEIEAPVARATPREMMQALNDSLEARVRRHPEQWFWIHRRWKAH